MGRLCDTDGLTDELAHALADVPGADTAAA